MTIYRVFAGSDGESHIEELELAQHPELLNLQPVTSLSIQKPKELRNMDFHPLPERRCLIHLAGEVEIGVSDGNKRILRAGDIRFMEDTTGKGHTHRDLSPAMTALMLLPD